MPTDAELIEQIIQYMTKQEKQKFARSRETQGSATIKQELAEKFYAEDGRNQEYLRLLKTLMQTAEGYQQLALILTTVMLSTITRQQYLDEHPDSLYQYAQEQMQSLIKSTFSPNYDKYQINVENSAIAITTTDDVSQELLGQVTAAINKHMHDEHDKIPVGDNKPSFDIWAQQALTEPVAVLAALSSAEHTLVPRMSM